MHAKEGLHASNSATTNSNNNSNSNNSSSNNSNNHINDNSFSRNCNASHGSGDDYIPNATATAGFNDSFENASTAIATTTATTTATSKATTPNDIPKNAPKDSANIPGNGSIYTGSVLLMEAILRRRSDVIDYLIANAPQLCLNLNSRDKTGSNILFYAASVGSVVDLHKLIRAGCRVESDYEGRTVLMQAALSGRVDIARFLVLSSAEVGLEIGQRDSMGRNALFYGVESNSLDMVEYLSSAGITSHPTEGDTTVLMQSARAGNEPMTRFLLDHSDRLNVGRVDSADSRGETALFHAVRSCSAAVVAALIERGADPLRDSAEDVNATSLAMNVAPHQVVVTILERAVPLDDDDDEEEEKEEKEEEEDAKGGPGRLEQPPASPCARGSGERKSEKSRGDSEGGVDLKEESASSSGEFPAKKSHACRATSPLAAGIRGCYDSDVSSCSSSSSSSSSGVCSRSTCSLYNSFNKSNCSNDELCGCADDLNGVVDPIVSDTSKSVNNDVIVIEAGTSAVNGAGGGASDEGEISNLDVREPSHGTPPKRNSVCCEVCRSRGKRAEATFDLLDKFSYPKDATARKFPTQNGTSDGVDSTSGARKSADETTCRHSLEGRTKDLDGSSSEVRSKTATTDPDSAGSTPGKVRLLTRLLWSKDNRSRSLVQYLIEAGETRLVMAYLEILENDESCKQKLRLEVDETGCSLLMSACKQPLDEPGAVPKAKERAQLKSRSSEMRASRLDLVKYLVEVVKIDPQGVDKGRRSALFYAVESGSLQVTSYLLQKTKTVESDRTGRTILMVAVATGNQLVVSEILASRFASDLLSARDEGGRTAFHFCAMQDCSVQSAVMLDTLLKYEETLRRERHLCQRPNLPDSADVEGRTPLMYACRSGNRSAVMRLLRNPRVQPDRRDSGGRTALHHCFAGANASLFCAGSLLRRNVDVNVADGEGVTCLMLACQSCSVTNIPVIRMLVEFGADSVVQDGQGRDSFDYCPPLNSHYVKAVLRDKTCMPASEREALWQMEQRLGEELHMNSVLRGLLREGIFTKTLNFEVMKQPPAERIQKLIEILVTRGRTAFRKFCKVLRQEGELDTSFELMRLAYVKEAELFW